MNTKNKLKSKNIVVKMESFNEKGPGRKRKNVVLTDSDIEETVGLPGFLQPNEHDLMDELIRMDSFSYGDR